MSVVNLLVPALGLDITLSKAFVFTKPHATHSSFPSLPSRERSVPLHAAEQGIASPAHLPPGLSSSSVGAAGAIVMSRCSRLLIKHPFPGCRPALRSQPSAAERETHSISPRPIARPCHACCLARRRTSSQDRWLPDGRPFDALTRVSELELDQSEHQ